MLNPVHEAYLSAVAADDAWHAAIVAEFPDRRAGDVRYTALAHGYPGTALRAAYDAWRRANAAHLAAVDDFSLVPGE